MADILSGYALYAPATFIIKGIMALAAYYLHRKVSQKAGGFPSRLISGLAAECIMFIGYYVFEGFLYGFIAAAVNIPANALQGAVGLVLGMVLIKMFSGLRLLH